MWFDFFPWVVFIPFALALLWSARPFGSQSKELFVLVWILAYFLAFSLAHGKTERYLLPLVPPMGLAIGYLYHLVLANPDRTIPNERVIRIFLGAFCALSGIGIIAVPFLLQWQRGVSIDVFPLPYIGVMIVLSGWLFTHIVSSRLRLALKGFGVLAVGWMLGIVGFLLPGIDAAASPRVMFQETKALLPEPDAPILAFQHWDWRGDEDLYYWQYRHPEAGIIGYQKEFDQAFGDLMKMVDEKGQVVIFMTPKQFSQFDSAQSAVTFERLRSFNRGKHKMVLVHVNNR